MADKPTKPRIAILEFKNKSDNQWWFHGGAEAAQDVFVVELIKSGKFRVIDREQLQALIIEKGLVLSGDVDPGTAVKVGKLLDVNYLLTGAVTEYGATEKGSSSTGKKIYVAAMNARLIDTATGETVWADEAKGSEELVSRADDQLVFDKVMKPVIQQLTASLKASDL